MQRHRKLSYQRAGLFSKNILHYPATMSIANRAASTYVIRFLQLFSLKTLVLVLSIAILTHGKIKYGSILYLFNDLEVHHFFRRRPKGRSASEVQFVFCLQLPRWCYYIFHALFILQELKKDPGIPRLPNLKVKVRNAQSKPMVSWLIISGWVNDGLDLLILSF